MSPDDRIDSLAKIQTLRLKKKDKLEFYKVAALMQVDTGRHTPLHEAVSEVTDYLKRSGYYAKRGRQQTK